MKPYQVNYRSVLALREIGKRHTALSTFCGYMNIPEPMDKKACQDIQKKLHCAYTETVESRMLRAANEFQVEKFRRGIRK